MTLKFVRDWQTGNYDQNTYIIYVSKYIYYNMHRTLAKYTYIAPSGWIYVSSWTSSVMDSSSSQGGDAS